jgi:2-iminoacetate synthase
LALEVGTQETNAYREMVSAGAEGLVAYQETYDRKAYAAVHLSGPKRHFDWRLETPERGYAAGFRRLGIGALYGLADWRYEAIALAAHACFLLKHCWQSQLTISLPRLRPHAGSYHPKTTLSDRELVQLTAALRLFLPDVGLVLSTRESPPMRDGLLRLGITSMSAGSHTEPGGYTGAGRDKVHLTERGRIKPLSDGGGATPDGEPTPATVQFQIADHRSPRQIADRLRQMDYEPVWKDWAAELTA